jgi:hypothetical protein
MSRGLRITAARILAVGRAATGARAGCDGQLGKVGGRDKQGLQGLETSSNCNLICQSRTMFP